jgi:hypothetical protein
MVVLSKQHGHGTRPEMNSKISLAKKVFLRENPVISGFYCQGGSNDTQIN